MQLKGLGICARQLVNQMSGIKSVDVIVPVRCAEIATGLRLRVVAPTEPATAQRLAHLGLRLPKGTREISHGVPKISRSIAQVAAIGWDGFLNCETRS